MGDGITGCVTNLQLLTKDSRKRVPALPLGVQITRVPEVDCRHASGDALLADFHGSSDTPVLKVRGVNQVTLATDHSRRRSAHHLVSARDHRPSAGFDKRSYVGFTGRVHDDRKAALSSEIDAVFERNEMPLRVDEAVLDEEHGGRVRPDRVTQVECVAVIGRAEQFQLGAAEPDHLCNLAAEIQVVAELHDDFVLHAVGIR